MSERASKVFPTEVTILTDVNVLAIGLTDDHPAHEDVTRGFNMRSMDQTSCSYSITIRSERSI